MGFFFWMASPPQAHPDGAPGFLQFEKASTLKLEILQNLKGFGPYFGQNEINGPFCGIYTEAHPDVGII